MATIPRMSRVSRRRLLRLGRACDVGTSLRFQAVAALGRADTGTHVARVLGLARSTVVRAAQRFVAEGVAGLYDRRTQNGLRKTGAAFDARIAKLLLVTPDVHGWHRSTWTRELLCLQLAKEGRGSVAVCTVGRALARIGARLGLPKPVVRCPWPRARRVERLAELRRLEDRASTKAPVLYVDEVDIHLNPRIGRDWMLPGQQRRVLTPGRNKKFYLAGALDIHTGALHTTGLEHKGTALFCDLLDLVAREYADARRIHIILDNYVIHSSVAATRALAAHRGRIRLHFLPPYCPDSNRIERVWQDLHANVTRNHRRRSLTLLLGDARRYLVNYRWRERTGLGPLLTQNHDR